MRRRFFVERFENESASIEGDAAHHLGRVLRAQVGQLYELSDGSEVWLAEIRGVSRERVEFRLIEKLASFRSTLETTLLLAIVKFDAFEWALEKATELGVERVVPLAAARSEKALLASAPKRAERWKKILLESSQQSRRVKVPILEPVAEVQAAFAKARGEVRIMLSESSDAKALREVLTTAKAQEAAMAIGPEGGWTEEEFTAARAASFQEASLGKLILRTETAVAAGLASLNFALSTD
jgi:16S rRNA (uracil1498-N3)-methyltransferase